MLYYNKSFNSLRTFSQIIKCLIYSYINFYMHCTTYENIHYWLKTFLNTLNKTIRTKCTTKYVQPVL